MDTLWTVIRDSFAKIAGAKFYFLEDRKKPNDLLSARADPIRGKPRLSEFSFINWTGGGGHIGFSPVSPIRGGEAVVIACNATVIAGHGQCRRRAAGPGHAGTMRLAQTRGQAKAVLEQRTDLDPAYIRLVVWQGLVEMPPWRPSELDDAALNELVQYLACGQQ